MSTQAFSVRHAAHYALSLVLNDGIPLDVVFTRAFDKYPPSERRDRAFAQNLVRTTLRNLGHVKKIVDAKLHRPIPHKAKHAEVWLWLGATQILFMDVPDHAAVDTSVEAIKNSKKEDRSFAGLTNAILRAITREKQTHLSTIAKHPADALPSWLSKRWQAQFGSQGCDAIAHVLGSQPPLDLTVICEKTRTQLLELEGAISVGPLNVRLNWKGPIKDIPGFNEGKWWVQDFAASLPVTLLNLGPEHKVLDLCAAPGGKTLQIAALGAKVIAVDKSSHRLERLKENLKRTGFKAEIIAEDLTTWEPPGSFERILLDAPCSGTGTIRRNPDIPWLKNETSIKALAELQAIFLDQSFGWLTDGGRLVYCVCSLEPEEGSRVIQAFLKKTPKATLAPVDIAVLPEAFRMAVSDRGTLMTTPALLAKDGGIDGFFIACLEKAV